MDILKFWEDSTWPKQQQRQVYRDPQNRKRILFETARKL